MNSHCPLFNPANCGGEKPCIILAPHSGRLPELHCECAENVPAGDNWLHCLQAELNIW